MRKDVAWAKVACVLGLGVAMVAGSTEPVFTIVSDAKEAKVARDRLLYEQDGSYVVKGLGADAEDFENLYVANMNNFFALPENFAQYGEALAFEPGKFAVVRLESEQKAGDLSHMLHHAGLACGALVKLDGGTISTELVATPEPRLPTSARDVRVERAVSLVNVENVRATVEELAALPTRFHTSPTGAGVATLLAAKYEALRGDRDDVTISTYDHGSATSQDSLHVRIEGTVAPTEVIVLGSHLDSIAGFGGSSRAPGADDNASGTATNLEIFRVLMAEGVRPERTIEIHAYAAEEIGLVGSNNMASRYKTAGVNVVAMVQHDMTLWKTAGTEDKIWLVTNNTNAGFNDLLAQLIDGYVGIAWGKQTLTAGSSDHASWHRQGYAAAFPFENPTAYNRSIHTANDTTANASWTQAAAFAKLGTAYVMHFGGVD